MPYTREQRREYERKRYAKKKKEQGRGRPRYIPLALRLPDTWIAQMQRMAMENIALGHHPWKTTQEVARALISYGFIALKDDDSVSQFVPQLELQQRLEQVDRAW